MCSHSYYYKHPQLSATLVEHFGNYFSDAEAIEAVKCANGDRLFRFEQPSGKMKLVWDRDFPIVHLKNGLIVANFSSPHSFRFDDGSELSACSEERARLLMLNAEEITVKRSNDQGVVWTDICLNFTLSDSVKTALKQLETLGVDIVLVPLPVMQAVKKNTSCVPDNVITKLRVCRVEDRVKKIISSTRFCL